MPAIGDVLTITQRYISIYQQAGIGDMVFKYYYNIANGIFFTTYISELQYKYDYKIIIIEQFQQL